jgi:DNA-binding transcriptional MerR regulator
MPTDDAAQNGAWTIDELTARVAAALSAHSPGRLSGRVREVPNVRTIRWYTTIGLLDRPSEMRGRTALYGRRHLAQIVAIKRLQAEGRSLTEVQERLIGADDAALSRIAALDDAGPPATSVSAASSGSSTSRDTAPGEEPPIARGRFWSAPPAATPMPVPTTASKPVPPPTDRPAPTGPAPLVHGVRLADDVTLLLSAARRAPDAAERRAIEEVAQPLLDLLHRLGHTDR